jgi:hypothetical protein
VVVAGAVAHKALIRERLAAGVATDAPEPTAS